MTNPVDAAIAAAQEKAAQTPDAAAVAVVEPQAQAVAVAAVGGPLSFDDLGQGSMACDDWLKVKDVGLVVASNTTKLFDSAEFIIDLATDAVACEVVKFGNPATYLKTFDRITCAEGGTWQEALNKANQVQVGARPYPSANITLEAVDDVKSSDGTVVVKKGDKLGHSTSTTNYANWSKFRSELKKLGAETATVKVKVGFEGRTNKANNSWGVLTFEIIEVLD